MFPLIGMMFFWCHLKYHAFYGTLFPTPLLPSASLPPTPEALVFFGSLFVLGIVCMALARQTCELLYTRRATVLMAGCLGALGAAALLAMASASLPQPLPFLAAAAVAVGAYVTCLAWALYFSSDFSVKSIVIIFGSFLLSILLLSGEWVPPFASLGSAVLWMLAAPPRRREFETGPSVLRNLGIYLWLIVALLVAGGVVHGLTKTWCEHDSFGWGLALAVAGTLCLAAFVHARRSGGDRAAAVRSGDAMGADSFFLIKCALLLMLPFFFGMLVCLVSKTYEVGGHIASIAKTSLNPVLLAALCGIAYEKGKSPVVMFTVLGLYTNLFCWPLTYVFAPRISAFDEASAGTFASVAIGFTVTFSLIALMLALLILMIMRRPQPAVSLGATAGGVALPVSAAAASPAEKAEAEEEPAVPQQLADECGLTPREVEVVELFARGWSLKRVAEILFISTQTAQTHIKNCYRKLEVHSKDELIDLLTRWNGN